MRRLFTVYAEGNKVVLDVMPYEPGGATLHLTPEEADALALVLKQAAGQAKGAQ